jgi:pimeloyl-ACP methyl ester carboxylesterase
MATAQQEQQQRFGRDVRFAGGSGVLTLELPAEGMTPWATAIFLHGSGPQDRNENSPALQLAVFDTLAADLAAAGIASLRYDKRGVGESPGDLLRCTVHDLAADARGAVRFVRRVHETAGLPVFLIGHSEGATIAMLLGADAPPPAGLVLLAPTITPMEDVLRLQAAGVQAAIASLGPAERQRLGIPDGFDQRRVTEQMIAAIKAAPPDQSSFTLMNQTVPSRWFRSHFDLDLPAMLEAVRCPVLSVGGGKDTQVPPRDAEAAADALRRAAQGRGETPDVAGVIVPDLTHVLRRSAGAGAAGEYAELCKQPVDQGLRALILEWLQRHRPAEPEGAAANAAAAQR